MIKLILFIFLILNFNRLVDTAAAILPPQKKPTAYESFEGCYVPELEGVLPYNGTYSPANGSSCIEYNCDQNGYTYIYTCGVIAAGDGCTIVPGNVYLVYPYCCDGVDCSAYDTNQYNQESCSNQDDYIEEIDVVVVDDGACCDDGCTVEQTSDELVYVEEIYVVEDDAEASCGCGCCGEQSSDENVASCGCGCAGEQSSDEDDAPSDCGCSGEQSSDEDDAPNDCGCSGEQSSDEDDDSSDCGYSGEQSSDEDDDSSDCGYSGEQSSDEDDASCNDVPCTQSGGD